MSHAENPCWEVVISPRFMRDHPELTKDRVQEGLMLSEWFLPVLESNQWIPGMGTTAHKAMPTAFAVGVENRKIIDVLVKPFDNPHLTKREFTATEIAYSRGINVPPMVALIDMGEKALLVGELAHDVEPLSAKSLDYKLTDPRVYNPHDFLEDFVRSIAMMHNEGITHGDLHLGNIGHQFFKDRTPKPIFFDLETAIVLGGHELICKNGGYFIDQEQRRKMLNFELEAVADLGTFTAYLRHHNFPIPRGKLLTEGTEIYRAYRTPSFGLIEGNDFKARLALGFAKTLKSLQENRKFPR